MTDLLLYDAPTAALTTRWSGELAAALAACPAVRLGETTVLSHRVHLQRADAPGEVQILTADAGRTFYGRRQAGEVIHADIFHDLAALDQRLVGQAITAASEDWLAADPTAWSGVGSPTDYLDLQTGGGGGRVSGALTYGQKPTLRRAHLNHVHLASGLPASATAMLLWLIAATERAIAAQGVQLRRVERISLAPPGREPADLGDYADISDSLLREGGTVSHPGQLAPADVAELVSLAEEFGGVAEARDVLDALRAEATSGEQRRLPARALTTLSERGLIAADQQSRYTLSPYGSQLQRALADHQREIELEFRRLLRRVPLPLRHGRPGGGSAQRQVERTGPVLRVRPVDAGEWPAELAPAETAIRALTRRFGTDDEGGGLRVDRADLCLRERGRPRPLDLCLLIDASASMAGRRIKAARYLTEHVLLATHDRVAVITFQERQVDVRVPFTRSYELALTGLRQIRPQGLTPLARGLLTAADYLRTTRAANPMILLITDGIPTVPEWTLNPISDACRAAGELARSRIQFTCIGLEPNREFLAQLARAGHGRLHIVSELDREQMVEVIHREVAGGIGAKDV